MKKEILFIHSAGSQGPREGSSDLVAYLRRVLPENYELKCPAMPDPENPRYEYWKMKIEKEMGTLSGKAILIGHSTGGSVLLKYLSEEPAMKSVAALFLIAAPYWGIEQWQMDEFMLPLDFPRGLPRIANIFLYHSHGDELVPFGHVRAYARKLPGATVREIEGNEHIFLRGLPVLADDIRGVKMMNGSVSTPAKRSKRKRSQT
ncbi:MAG TPA: alpha/beta hydrolase [Ohtaekwangia sp.]|nr:alpha/beta hydrolase [Ohtaekwangia sp.]